MTDKLGLPPNLAGALRDAVHVPIVALCAGQTIPPGDRIALIPGTTQAIQALRNEDVVGVADPFFPRLILRGEWFWAMLMPNSITGLRHDWVHPAFPAPEKDEEEYDDGCRHMGCDE